MMTDIKETAASQNTSTAHSAAPAGSCGGYPKLSDWLRELCRRRISDGRIISITGGGGKTSLLYKLGRVISPEKPVLLATTTKIFRPEPEQCRGIFTGPASYACRFVGAMERPALLTAAAREDGGKMIGYGARDLDEASGDFPEIQIISECDGSRGLSVKYYEEWEPPVPQKTGLLFAVAGADAIVNPADERAVFRSEKFCGLYKIKYGAPLAPSVFLRYIISDGGPLKNCPADCVKIAVINKWDAIPDETRRALSDILKEALRRYDAVVCASVKEDRIFKILER